MASDHGFDGAASSGLIARPLSVAIVTETYPPEINGVATTVSRIVSGLRERGHTVQLVRPRQGGDGLPVEVDRFSEILTRGFAIPRYPELKVGLPARRRLRHLWKRSRPDVVHLATEGPLGWSALRAAASLSIPTVSEFRTNFHAYSQHYGVGFLQGVIFGYLRRFHNQTGCTMVPTSGLAGELKAGRFERLEVVGRGVDTELFHPMRRSTDLRARWNVDDDSLVVLGVGRLAPEKNLQLLCDAFRRIREVRRDSKLVLVGDGPSRDWVRARCPEAILTGRRSGADLAAHFASADLLLFPSLTETFGNVTLEGMASGLPVVAFDYGAAGEFIRTGVTGWLAPYADSEGFLSAAAEACLGAEARRLVGLRARQVACSMGWGNVIGEILRHYDCAIRGQPQRVTWPLISGSTQREEAELAK